MKKIMTVIAALAFAATSFAQAPAGTVSITPMVGVSLADITNANGDMKVGFVGGAEAQYQLTDMFALSGGLLYSMQGTKYDNGSLKTSYLNVPVLVNAYLPVKGLAVKLGLQPGFLLSADAEAHAFGFSGNGNMKDYMESFDLSMPIGVSYEFNNIVLDARYNFGLTNVFKNDGRDSDDASQNSVFQITLGYRF